MAYSPPSPSDSNSSSKNSESDRSETRTTTGWTGQDPDLPVTPSTPFATIANFHRASVTSALKTHNMTPTSSPSSTTSTPKTHNMSPTSSPSSTTSTATSIGSIPQARGRRYASEPDDWLRHKARIENLYLEQKKTLRTVMREMEDEHNFVATERMYKARFKEWGCGKNVTASTVVALLEELDQLQELPEQVQYAHCTGTTTRLGHLIEVGKRVNKYVKRHPAGIKKLEDDPRRPLDALKVLAIDSNGRNGKGRMGRSKVLVPPARLEYQQPQTPLHLMSPQSDMMMPWSPGEGSMAMDGLPDEMTRLLQNVVDQEFSMAYSYACSPLPLSPTPSSPWQNTGSSQLMGSPMPSSIENFQAPDQMMLEFVLKFRIAHILLDDGMSVQAFEVVNLCMNILTTRLHQTQGSDSRAAGTVILYALTAALEMSISFTHLDMLHMLFQHINNVCREQQPRMAEIARRMPQLSHMHQIPMLKLARMMMSRAAVGYSGHENPSYEAYSRTVDIAISHDSENEKLRQLQVYLADPVVQSMPQMVAWMEERISLAVCDASMAIQQSGFWNGHTPIAGEYPLWNQGDKITAVLKYSSERIDWYKMTGNWAAAERWARDLAWLAELARGVDDELSRKFRADIESVKSPMLGQSPRVKSDGGLTAVAGPMGVSLPSMHSLHASMSLPEVREFKQDMDHLVPMSSSTWHQGQGQYRNTTLPSLWNATGDTVDGMSGASLYDTSSSFQSESSEGAWRRV